MLRQLEHRRKAIIYVSAGYDLNPFEESRFLEARSFGGMLGDEEGRGLTNLLMNQTNYQFADLDMANHMSRLVRAANRANATFYTIDPRGLMAGVDLGRDERPARSETVVGLCAEIAG